MRVFIWDFTHDKYYPVDVPIDIQVDALLKRVLPQICKGFSQEHIYAYLLETGRRLTVNSGKYMVTENSHKPHRKLHFEQTLASANISENDVLVLVPYARGLPLKVSCPWCGKNPSEDGGIWRHCPTCATLHHETCWEKYEGCANWDCLLADITGERKRS